VGTAANQLVQVSFEQLENAKALATRLRYDGPLHPDALEAGIADARARIAAELFGMGARLLLLKEQCEHGEFMERCQRLGLERNLVNRTMQATLKFSNSSLTSNLANLGKTKLFEMLVLDDEEVKELEYAGSVRAKSTTCRYLSCCLDLLHTLQCFCRSVPDIYPNFPVSPVIIA